MRARRSLPTLVAGLAVAWLALRVGSLPAAVTARASMWERLQTALTRPRDWRIFASTGVAAEELAALRVLGQDGRLIAYADLALVPAEQRANAELILETQHHRWRSLLYPKPSDTRRANGPADLERMLAEPCAGELVVADLSQTGAPLPTTTAFTLLLEQRHDGFFVRYWRRSTPR